jgi:hypothetical protein
VSVKCDIVYDKVDKLYIFLKVAVFLFLVVFDQVTVVDPDQMAHMQVFDYMQGNLYAF